VVENRQRQRVFDEEHLGLAGKQRQTEAFARWRREAGAIGAHRGLVEPLIVREVRRVAQHDPPVHWMRGPERKPASVRGECAGDDAVADVERFVRSVRIQACGSHSLCR